jgi:glycosyltransferase involved in cell wall biosynthesis
VIDFAILTPNLTPGGAERHCLALARYGPARGLRCTGVALSGWGGLDAAMADELRELDVPLYVQAYQGGPRPFAAERATAGFATLAEALTVAARGAQVLITWGSTNLARFTAGLGLPIVCVSHCSIPARTACAGITHFVGVSEAGLRHFDGCGVADLPRAVIYNGAETHRLVPKLGRATQRAAWGFADTDRVLLSTGRHAIEKRPEAALQALAHLPPAYKLVSYGVDPQTQDRPLGDLVALAEQLGLADRVRWERPVTHLGDVLLAANAFLLLSERETNSLGLLEAFLVGLPAVCTPVGAIDELERIAGGPLVWRASQVAAEVAETIRDAAEAGHADIVDRACAVARREWTADAMLARWHTYLTGVLEGRHGH